MVKSSTVLLILALAAVVGLLCLLRQHHRALAEQTVREMEAGRKDFYHNVEMAGVHYVSIHNGEKVLSLRAERFKIEKKKVGFFRFGLINEGVLDNAAIDLQVDLKEAGPAGVAAKSSLSALLSAAPMFSKDRIASVRMAPVCVTLSEGDAVLTRLTSDAAELRMKDRSIVFSGNVRLTSRDNALSTSELVLFPERSVLECRRPYVLTTAGGKREGIKISVDFLLNILDSASNQDHTVGPIVNNNQLAHSKPPPALGDAPEFDIYGSK